MGTLNKGALQSAIESAFRSMEPGQDGVNSLASLLANAIDSFVKSGTVDVTSSGGSCSYSGTHPPIDSTGQVT